MDSEKILSCASPCESTIEVASEEAEEVYDRKKNDAIVVDQNATKHLENIYSLEGTMEDEVVTSTDWLFSSGSGKWPGEVKPFFWRYLHDHKLYNARKDNFEAVEQLCQDLKKYLHLTCSPSDDDEIRRKIERQIQYVAKEWKDYGFLIQAKGAYTRTPIFEKRWKEARDKWISVVHRGITTGLIELSMQEIPRPTSARIITSDGKEYRSSNYPSTTSLTTPDTPVNPIKKRKYGESRSAEDARFSSGESDDSPAPRRKKTPRTAKLTSNPIRPSSDRAHRMKNTKTATRKVKESFRPFDPVRQAASNQHDARSPTQTMFGEDEYIRSPDSCSRADRHDSEEQPHSRGRRPTIQKNDSGSISTNIATRSASTTSSTFDTTFRSSATTTRKAKLNFIFEDSKAAQERPVSAGIFRKASLPEFFDLVYSRAFKQHSSIKCLTFRYTWGTLEAFVVSRTTNEEDWMSIKRKVRNKFLIAREDVRNKDIDFEVWVTCGDTTKEVKDGNIDSDVDEEDW